MDFLHRFAAPTGARGSVLLMTGGLIVLGFLFMAFLFRSAIVGDLAPVANARSPMPRAALPPIVAAAPRAAPQQALPPEPFKVGREAGRQAGATLDEALDKLSTLGADARILQSGATWKRIRLYGCLTCEHERGREGCEHERGLLAGAFETLTEPPRRFQRWRRRRAPDEQVQVREIACSAHGMAFCEFEVRHPPLRRGWAD